MEKNEIEELRGRVGCAAVLEDDGWKVDVKESTRRAVKYRRDAKIVIVIHDGRGWFDPLSTAKGDVFNLAEHLGARGFPEASSRVAALVGFVPAAPPWERPSRPAPIRSVADRWGCRTKPRPGSATWRYLTGDRGIPDPVVATAVQQDLLREGPHGSMWAAHRDAGGALLGWEERGPQWRGFATGGAKELFRLGPSAAARICVTEAAIDDATVFTSAVHGEIADGAVGYAFEGTTWLAIVGNSKEAAMQSAYLPAVVAALRAANAG